VISPSGIVQPIRDTS